MMYCKNTSGRADREPRDPGDMIQTLKDFFDAGLLAAMQWGIKRNQIIADPGMGAFVSPNYEDSVRILQHIKELKKYLKLPILI